MANKKSENLVYYKICKQLSEVCVQLAMAKDLKSRQRKEFLKMANDFDSFAKLFKFASKKVPVKKK